MRCFSLPYNNDILILNKLETEFHGVNGCSEIYFAVSNNWIGSGRSITQTDLYEEEILTLTHTARDKGIECNILLNAGCLDHMMSNASFIKNILMYLSSLVEKMSVDTFTVSDYLLAKEIKMAFPKIKIECSSIAYIDSVAKAKYWIDIGCDILVIPPVLNKNLRFIKELRNEYPKLLLKLVTNQRCLFDCPMWIGHHNIRAHGNEGFIYNESCHKEFADKPWKYYSSSYIPPEYLSFYDKYIDIYKLVDRRFSTDMILNQFSIYSNEEEKYKDELYKNQLSITAEQFEKILYCNKNCANCKFCEDIYEVKQQFNISPDLTEA